MRPRFVVTKLATIDVGVLVMCLAVPVVARAQHMPSTVRIDAGSLNHGYLLRANLAIGATLGWEVNPGGEVQLRYLRQSQSDAGTDVGRHSRTWFMADWEHAFGTASLHKRQALLRAGIGAMFRPVFHPAPALGAGFEVRYGLAQHWALLADFEDDAAALWAQDAMICDPFRGCATYHFDAKLEHNIGLLISGEWSR